MVCKNCGAVIAENAVFCEKCGTKIVTIQDYSESEDVISDELLKAHNKDREAAANKTRLEQQKKDRQKKGIIIGFASAVILVALVLAISLVISNNKNNKSFTYQYGKAYDYFKNGLPDKALVSVNKALAIEPDNEDALMLLYSIYMEQGKEDKAIDALLTCINYNPTSYEAYTSIIDLYTKRGEFKEIEALASNVTDETMALLFRDILPKAPKLSVEEGKYDDEFELEIKADDSCIVYYTLDGSDPKENGIMYMDSIEIKVGETVLRVVATNEYGLYSEEVSAKYVVEFSIPDKPTVSIPSGTYEEAMMITIIVPSGCKAYYTWDGTTPNRSSILYQGPFEMIEGNNILSVIIINDKDQSSDVARFNYIYYPSSDDEDE
ncbi:MAG: chitobiase/beta-hexosaminidase C-terminal domain-containing protein [Lachnospiraceae bacterium]|nr:chitobiase/beta-hexosaminidase C-terminal domain-containing protein [Lachnospiraceae bacterium]